MTTYDPAIIQKFANDLYRRADGIILTFCIVGGLVGFVVGSVAMGGALIGLVLGLLGVGLGYLSGQQRAFVLKLQAQTALCQVEIEKNTRR